MRTSIIKRCFAAIVFSSTVVCVPFFSSTVYASQSTIQQLGDQAVRIFSSGSPNLGEFRNLFQQYFDMRAIAQSVLGPFWRQGSDAQKERFLRVFEDRIINYYFNFLKKHYHPQDRFSAGASSGAAVDSKIIRGNGKEIPMRWFLSGGRVVDVVVEGISSVSAKRAEYTQIMRQCRNDWEAFLGHVEQRGR